MDKLTLLDLDSIVYIVAYQYKDMGQLASLQAAEHATKFINNILDKTDADCYIGYYQVEGHKNYRLLVDSNYKSNRPETPDYIRALRPAIHKAFDSFVGVKGLSIIESDDAMSIAAKALKGEYDITLARIDKDLACIPGHHYNYKKDSFEDIDEEYAIRFRKLMILAGDSGDGIPSIPKIGMKTAAKYVDNHESVVQAYREAAKVKNVERWMELFYKSYHCINLLDTLDELKKFTDETETVNITTPEYLIQNDIAPENQSW